MTSTEQLDRQCLCQVFGTLRLSCPRGPLGRSATVQRKGTSVASSLREREICQRMLGRGRGTHQGSVASVCERSDDKTRRIAQVLEAIEQSGVYLSLRRYSADPDTCHLLPGYNGDLALHLVIPRVKRFLALLVRWYGCPK